MSFVDRLGLELWDKLREKKDPVVDYYRSIAMQCTQMQCRETFDAALAGLLEGTELSPIRAAEWKNRLTGDDDEGFAGSSTTSTRKETSDSIIKAYAEELYAETVKTFIGVSDTNSKSYTDALKNLNLIVLDAVHADFTKRNKKVTALKSALPIDATISNILKSFCNRQSAQWMEKHADMLKVHIEDAFKPDSSLLNSDEKAAVIHYMRHVVQNRIGSAIFKNNEYSDPEYASAKKAVTTFAPNIVDNIEKGIEDIMQREYSIQSGKRKSVAARSV